MGKKSSSELLTCHFRSGAGAFALGVASPKFTLWRFITSTHTLLLIVVAQLQQWLCKNLVCKGARHYKGWVTCGTAKVEKTPGCKHNDSMAIWEYKSVHLWFDIFHFDSRPC